MALAQTANKGKKKMYDPKRDEVIGYVEHIKARRAILAERVKILRSSLRGVVSHKSINQLAWGELKEKAAHTRTNPKSLRELALFLYNSSESSIPSYLPCGAD